MIIFLFLNCYNSRIIQEYSQDKFGRNKNIQPGPKKQHSKIFKKSVLPSKNLVVTAILSGFCPDLKKTEDIGGSFHSEVSKTFTCALICA